MTIKQQGGIFGRNPTFNDVTVDGTLSTNDVTVDGTLSTNDVTVDGTLSTGGALSTGGTISTTSNMVIESGSPNIRFAETDTTDENYRIRVQAGQFIFEKIADNNSIVTECFRVDSSNNLALKTGSLVVANGQGIDFSATSGTGTSELFDDYEEGTWTPTYVPQTGSFASITYSAQSGTYTKVGDTVHAFFDLSATIDVTGASGNVSIAGLPFSGLSTACFGGVGRARRFANTFTFGGFLTSGSSLILYKQDTDDLNYINLDVTDLATGGLRNFITAGVTYKVS